jgi:hypothetical protein
MLKNGLATEAEIKELEQKVGTSLFPAFNCFEPLKHPPRCAAAGSRFPVLPASGRHVLRGPAVR